MANAWCINAIWFDWTLIQTLQQLDSANIWVWVQYTAPSPLDDKRLDYIKYTDKCWNTCCITWENELLIYATQWVIKNLTLTNDDTNEVVNVKRTDLFWSNWKKTVVRYKTWSFPTSVTDWTLAVEETTMNQYSSTWFDVSWLDDATTYYFSAFAVAQDDTIIVVQSDSVETNFYPRHISSTTLWLRRLEWDCKDSSSNHYDWTPTDVTYTTLSSWLKVATFNWSSSFVLTPWVWNLNHDRSCIFFVRMHNFSAHPWCISKWSDTANDSLLQLWFIKSSWTNWTSPAIWFYWDDYTLASSTSTNIRVMLAYTFNYSTKARQVFKYTSSWSVNWSNTATWTYTLWTWWLYFWRRAYPNTETSNPTQYQNCDLSSIIFEKRIVTATEIANFWNNMKAKFWIS